MDSVRPQCEWNEKNLMVEADALHLFFMVFELSFFVWSDDTATADKNAVCSTAVAIAAALLRILCTTHVSLQIWRKCRRYLTLSWDSWAYFLSPITSSRTASGRVSSAKMHIMMVFLLTLRIQYIRCSDITLGVSTQSASWLKIASAV